jgi:hypothetical protein
MLTLSGVSAGQPWAGVLSPARAINWTVAGAGTIPNRTTICADPTSSLFLPDAPMSITSISDSYNTSTMTHTITVNVSGSLTAHATVGEYIEIAGVTANAGGSYSPSTGYNGGWQITAVGSGTLQYQYGQWAATQFVSGGAVGTATATRAAANAAAINAAISGCTSGQVVKIDAGTWHSAGLLIGVSGITLRGSGADQTILIFDDKNGCGGVFGDVCLSNGDGEYSQGPGGTANWTGTTEGGAGVYPQGATHLTISGASGSTLQVGMTMYIDQLEDTSDTGNVYVAQISSGAGQTCVSCNNPGRTNRGQTQLVLVTGISGSTVTVTPGIYMPNWRASQSPGAWWGTYLPTTEDGVENMTLDSSNVVSGGGIVSFYNCLYCWEKGTRSLSAKDSHVKFWYGSMFDTVRDSYFYGSQGHGSSTQSYGVDGYTGSNNLVENNIFQHISADIVMEDEQGSVFGYNYSIDPINIAEPSWILPTNVMHAPGNDYNLAEGNDNVLMQQDDIHGPSDFITYFRNRLSGWNPGILFQSIPIYDMAWSRYTNAVGNVLGQAGFHNNYVSVPNDGLANMLCYHSIFVLGKGGNCVDNAVGSGPQSDSLVPSTIVRWGNYDTVNAAVLECTGTHAPTANCLSDERGDGAPVYPGLANPSTSFPASFYSANYSAFWSTSFGTPPYPPIGPDVSDGNMPNYSGHANYIPSALVFQNLSTDPTYSASTKVTGATCSNSSGTPTVTLTIGSQAAVVDPGAVIIVTGMNPSGYNTPAPAAGTPRTQIISSDGTANITYAVASCPGAFVSGGSAVAPAVFSFNANVYSGGGGAPPAPTGLAASVH